jgi:GR25 family glycosyltransferase involved in LPS biosynthesis
MNDEELENHYINYGINERRSYKINLPNDFNCSNYKKLNNDLVNMNDEELENHYINYGYYEKYNYKINLSTNFDVKTYKKLNNDLVNMNDEELRNHYINYGINEERSYKINLSDELNKYDIKNIDNYLLDDKLEIEKFKFYLINLDERTDRLNESIDQFNKIKLKKIERYSAIKPTMEDINKCKFIEKSNLFIKDDEKYIIGAAGCKMSHYNILKQSLNKDKSYKYICIFEDDIYFENDIILNLSKSINYIEDNKIDFDIFYLGVNLNKENDAVLVHNNLLKINYGLTTTAQIFKYDKLDKIIKLIENSNDEIDNTYNLLGKKYCLYPMGVHQRKSYSNILSSIQDYGLYNKKFYYKVNNNILMVTGNNFNKVNFISNIAINILHKELNTDIYIINNEDVEYYNKLFSNYNFILIQNIYFNINNKLQNQTYIYVIYDISELLINKDIIINNIKYIDIYIYLSYDIKNYFENNIYLPEKSFVINDIIKLTIENKESNIDLYHTYYYSFINKYKVLLNRINTYYANIFYHLFYVGGGEIFIETLIENTEKKNMIYVSNYNEITKTFSKKINNNIIIYEDVYELNKYLKYHNIIFDNQLYWGDLKNYEIIYKDNKIINIVHGNEILENKSIINNFLSYVPNKQKYINSNITFNNLLNFDKYIITKKNKIIGKPVISIIGSIYEYKIPKESWIYLKELSNNFKILFIGDINNECHQNFKDELKSFFINNDVEFLGMLEKNKLFDILYSKVNIVLSLSKNELGGYNLIDSLKMGIPIICRNTNTLSYVNSNKNNLYNNYYEINSIANNIINNLEYESKIASNYILNNSNTYINTNYILFTEYILQMKQLNKIPNIVHFIFGLKEQTEDFKYVYYLSILSYLYYNKPKYCFFWYIYEPYGKYWDIIKNKLILINIPENTIFKLNDKIVTKYAHKADILRMEILLKYGGVYLDIDTITYKSFNTIYNFNNYDFFIGIQEKDWKYNNKKINLLCNAIMASKPNSKFMVKWWNKYYDYLSPDKWCEASVHLPSILYNEWEKINNIYIANENMMYKPLYSECNLIFENNENVSNDLLILHHWNSFSNKYYDNINERYIIYNDTMYAKIVKKLYKELNTSKFYNELLPEYSFFDFKYYEHFLKNTYNVSVIIPYYYTPKNIFRKSIISILNQRNLLYLNIEVILIDDGTHECLEYLKEIKEIEEMKYLIKFKVIELNENVGVSKAIDIGIEYSSYDIIVRFDADDIMHPDRISYQIDKLEKIGKKNIILSSHFKVFNDNLELTNYSPRSGLKNIDDLIDDVYNESHLWYVCHPSVIFNKKYVISKYPNNCKGLCEDLILWIYNSCNNIEILYDCDILHLYRINNNNTSIKNVSIFDKWKSNFINLIKNSSDKKNDIKNFLYNNYFNTDENNNIYIKEIHNI